MPKLVDGPVALEELSEDEEHQFEELGSMDLIQKHTYAAALLHYPDEGSPLWVPKSCLRELNGDLYVASWYRNKEGF